jgi:DNA polymerase-1
MKTLLLIDANSLVHRAYHALPPMNGASGNPTNALYGLSSILLKLWREEKPEYAAACFDRPEPTFRDLEYKEYKAQRPATADDLLPQIVAARDLFPQFGVSVFEMPGYEADDLIGTLACRFADEPDLRVVILTGDRDTLQLVKGDKVVVRTPQKGISETLTYDAATVEEKYGLAPKQLIDYKALVGDASDNIKGVNGIGPKTAATILQKFGTLESALSHPDDPLVKKVVDQREIALQAKRLVTLQCEAPIEAGLEDLFVRADDEQLREYFDRMGFSTLASASLASLKAKLPEKRKSRRTLPRKIDRVAFSKPAGTLW